MKVFEKFIVGNGWPDVGGFVFAVVYCDDQEVDVAGANLKAI